MIKLSTYEEQQIARKLPPQLAAFKSKYPSAVYNAASAKELPSLAPGIEPEIINFYYGEEDNSKGLPNISFKNRKLDLLYLTEDCINNPVIQVEFDGQWAYIEVEKQALLDRTGNVKLPEIEEISEEEIEAVARKTLSLIEGVNDALFE